MQQIKTEWYEFDEALYILFGLAILSSFASILALEVAVTLGFIDDGFWTFVAYLTLPIITPIVFLLMIIFATLPLALVDLAESNS